MFVLGFTLTSLHLYKTLDNIEEGIMNSEKLDFSFGERDSELERHLGPIRTI